LADNPSITTSRRNIIKTISAGIATTAVAGCTGPPDADQSKSATENISNSSDTNALKYRIQELETREQKLESKLNTTQTKKSKLESELETEREKRKELKSELEERDPDIAQYRSKIEELEATVEKLETQIDENSKFSKETLDRAYETGNKVRESVVDILGGTGFHIGDGNIITNRHVVGEHTEGFVQAYAERESNMPKHDFTVVGKGDSHTDDIAMVSTDATHLPSLELGDPANLEKGQPLIAVGHPSSTGRYIIMIGEHDGFNVPPHLSKDYHTHKTTIRSSPGASGSPIMTLDGTVMSVLYASQGLADAYAPEKVHQKMTHGELSTVGISTAVLQTYLDDWL